MTVLHRSTWMSNMRLTQRSNSPSSSCQPIRFLMLLLHLQLRTLGALAQQHGAFSRRNRQQRPNLWAPHLHMKDMEFTLLCQTLAINIREKTSFSAAFFFINCMYICVFVFVITMLCQSNLCFSQKHVVFLMNYSTQ